MEPSGVGGPIRFRAGSSMASGGAGYREHHPGHGVLSRTGPDPLPASDATLFPPPEIRSTVDRRDGRFGPQAEIWRSPDDPPWQQVQQALLRGLVYNLRRAVAVAGIFCVFGFIGSPPWVDGR
jgi:hypothetical protein